MEQLVELAKRVNKIEMRNSKVEEDKSWETSYSRRILIALFTYLAIAIYLKFIVGINPWINAIIPTTGFLLSTFTLPYFKKIWSKYLYKKEQIL